MELLSLVNEIVTQGKTSNILKCPSKYRGCVEEFHCGKDCQFAQAAHRAFQTAISGTTTTHNGERGILTAGARGSFETINGQVIYVIN
jgi:hypothetical protein